MRYVPPAFPIANISIANTHYDLVDRVQIIIDILNSRHIFLLDDISPLFDGVQTTFTMTSEGGHRIDATTALNVVISLNGTMQEPRSAYNVYANQLTFSSPPLPGTSFYGIVMDVWAGTFTGSWPPDTAHAATATTASSANTLGGKSESQLNVNSATFVTGTVLQANNANFLGGHAESQLNVNSAADVTTFGGQAPSYYTNANNLTGVLPAGVLAGLYANATVNNATFAYGKNESQLNVNSASFVSGSVNAAIFLSGNAITSNSTALIFASTAGVYANGGKGSSGQVLTTNGTTVYWANATSGNATFLSGNTVTTNSTGLFSGANVSLNTSAHFVGNSSVNAYLTSTTLTINQATVNSSFYTGKANTANVANTANAASFLAGNTVTTNSTGLFTGANISLNTSAVFAGNSSVNAYLLSTGLVVGSASVNSSAHFVGNSSVNAYLTATTLTINQATVNSTFYTGRANTANVANTANDTSYAFGKSESQLNVNAALGANNAAYLGGFAASTYLYKYAGGSPGNGQVLTYSSGNSSWYAADPTGNGGVSTHTLLQSNVHTDTTNGTVTRGDVITGQGATPKWTRLALGTATYVLTSNGTEAVWAAPTGTAGGTNTQKLDSIAASFNGAQTQFTLTVSNTEVTPTSVENVLISLAGIVQEPNTAFTLSGNTITFAAAPGPGTPFFGVLLGSTTTAENANNANYLGGKAEADLNVNSAVNWACTTPQFTRIGVGAAPDAAAVGKFSGQYFSPLVDDGNSGAALTIDWNAGNEHKVTLTGNCTFTFSNPVSGGRYVLLLFQDASGSRFVTWPGTVVWPGAVAPVLTTAIGKMDIITFIYDSTTTTYYGAYSQNY